MDETQAFLDDVLPRQRTAERAIHEGDAAPRLAMWSHRDPLTLLGAAMPCVTGAATVRETFGRVELVAAGASGDLAYTVVFEHTSCAVEGVPKQYRLRVTHVYRREDDAWRIVHRHADEPPGDTAFSGVAG
jgi:ketosteroid isomerase-like protein